MTSTIKDKPLKKIKADLRITVDSIHNAQINNIKNNLDEKTSLENDINDLKQKFVELHPVETLCFAYI